MPHEQAEANAVLQEVHILASLEHPFIVRYYDSFVETRKLFLVMEFAANGSLHTVLAQHQRTQRPLAEDTVWRYTIQLLLGLHAIHMRRVVHRDIKPHNIFLGEGDVRARAARSSDLGADYLPPGLLSPWPAVSLACCLPGLLSSCPAASPEVARSRHNPAGRQDRRLRRVAHAHWLGRPGHYARRLTGLSGARGQPARPAVRAHLPSPPPPRARRMPRPRAPSPPCAPP